MKNLPKSASVSRWIKAKFTKKPTTNWRKIRAFRAITFVGFPPSGYGLLTGIISRQNEILAGRLRPKWAQLYSKNLNWVFFCPNLKSSLISSPWAFGTYRNNILLNWIRHYYPPLPPLFSKNVIETGLLRFFLVRR